MKLFLILTTFLSAAAFAQVSVNVNGTQYQCSTDGNNTGGTGMNYCRCRAQAYGNAGDFDYYLEKYNPQANTYTLLQTFNLPDATNNDTDRQHCMDARQDPGCFFAANSSRFMKLTPIVNVTDSEK